MRFFYRGRLVSQPWKIGRWMSLNIKSEEAISSRASLPASLVRA